MKFPIGSRVRHNCAGLGTVTGTPRQGHYEIELPVLFDSKERDGSSGWYEKYFTLVSLPQPVITQADVDAARADGNEEGFQRGHDAARIQIDVEGKIGKQLLNELYHDRARLERVVKDAVNLVSAAERYIGDYDDNTDESGNEVTSDLILGWLTQFRDTHGPDEG